MVCKFALFYDLAALASFAGLAPEHARVVQVRLDAHLLLVDHEECVENSAECEQRDRIEVNCVFLDFNIVALTILLVDLALVLSQVFLADGNDGRVSEILNWSQVYKEMISFDFTYSR